MERTPAAHPGKFLDNGIPDNKEFGSRKKTNE